MEVKNMSEQKISDNKKNFLNVCFVIINLLLGLGIGTASWQAILRDVVNPDWLSLALSLAFGLWIGMRAGIPLKK